MSPPNGSDLDDYARTALAVDGKQTWRAVYAVAWAMLSIAYQVSRIATAMERRNP